MIDRGYWRLAHKVVASVYSYSDQSSSSYSATRAVNGSTSDYWRTNNPVGAYIVVKLAEASAIENLRWYVGNTTYFAKAFTVAGSNDGNTFTDLFSGGCTGTSGWQGFHWINEIPYEYIRVTCDAANSSYLYTYELEFGIVEKQYFDKSYGKYLVAVFDGPVSAPDENDIQHFSVMAPMAVARDGGNLVVEQTQRTIESIVQHPDVVNAFLITLADTERIDECGGPVILSYDGTGSLTGYGRPVTAFQVEFEPLDIAYKGDQNNTEHFEISSMIATGVVIRVEYLDAKSSDEHLEISNVIATGIVTHVDDI